MDAKRIQKMMSSGDRSQLRKAEREMRATLAKVQSNTGEMRKAVGTMNAALAKLSADVEMLKAQGPIIVPQSTYRVVTKADDDLQLSEVGQRVYVNGGAIDPNQFLSDVRMFAQT